MLAQGTTLWIGLILTGAGGSLALLWLIGVFMPAAARAPSNQAPTQGFASFLFEAGVMIDHDAGTLPESEDDALTWPTLRDWLASRFAGLPADLEDVAEGTPQLAQCRDPLDDATVEVTRYGDTFRVVLSDPSYPCTAERHATLIERASLAEQRAALQAAPYPVWTTTTDGAPLWQNAACGRTFDADMLRDNVSIPDAGDTGNTRFSIPGEAPSDPRWYEVHSAANDGHVIHHATDVTKTVRAETAQRDFVQTLTKTFAYLSIGLAVFDKNRRLALFNPSLVDLTALPPDFLSARPEMMSFFDNLRNRQVMPEPRSYASWRAQINAVIETAKGGLYQETWSLPNEVTYRVTGRPHPDGAIAFLFEDITAEVLVARRFRSQLDLRQSALDSLPEAVMIIGPNDVLSLCNDAATRLLGIDPDSCFADMSVADLIGACMAKLPNTDFWSRIETALRQRTLSAPLHDSAAVPGLGMLTLRIELLPGGARMLILDTESSGIAPLHAERTPVTAD